MNRLALFLLALLAPAFSFAADRVATCVAPALSCPVTYVLATPETLSFNTATGKSCWVNQSTCLWRKLSAMAPTDVVYARTGATGAASWQPRSAVTYTVAPPPPPPPTTVGTATVTWSAPTTNTNGTPLTDLAGFNVYKGASATTLVLVANVTASVLSWVDAALPPGTYFYAVTAVNAAGKESAQSAPVSIVLAISTTPGAPTVSVTVTVP